MNPLTVLLGIVAAVIVWSGAALYIARHWLAKAPPYISVPNEGNDGEHLS